MTFKNHKLLKVLSLNSFSVAIQFFLSLFTVKIVASFLGPSGMALLGNFRNFTSLVKSLCVIGLKEGLIRLLIENNEDSKSKSELLNTFLVFFMSIALGLMLLILLFSKSISLYLFQTDVYYMYLCCFALLLPFFVIQTFYLTLLNSNHEFKKIIIIQIIINILLFLSSIILIYKFNLKGAFFAISIADFISFSLFFFVCKSAFSFSFNVKSEYLKAISKYVLMAVVSAILVPLTAIIIRNFIIKNDSINTAGIWEAVNRISGFYMLFFTAGLSLYYLPRLAEIETDSEFVKELKYYFKFLVPLFVFILLVVFLFKDWIISVALTPNFNKVTEIMIWQLLGDFFRFMTLAFGYQILVKAMVKKYIFIEIFFNLLFIGGSIALFSLYNIEGIVMAYALSNFIIFLVALYFFKNLLFQSKLRQS